MRMLQKTILKKLMDDKKVLVSIKELKKEDYLEYYGDVKACIKTEVSLWQFIFFKEILNMYISHCNKKGFAIPNYIKYMVKEIKKFRKNPDNYTVNTEVKVNVKVVETKREKKVSEQDIIDANLNNIVSEIERVIKKTMLKKSHMKFVFLFQ